MQRKFAVTVEITVDELPDAARKEWSENLGIEEGDSLPGVEDIGALECGGAVAEALLSGLTLESMVHHTFVSITDVRAVKSRSVPFLARVSP